jgi:riboflavin synthase
VFTGIVEEVGKVERIQGSPTGAILGMKAARVLQGTESGDSIAVNGVCLTVTALHPHGFTVDLSAETLRQTNLDKLQVGDPLNLERSLSFGGKVGGHFVQGHVDGTGTVVQVVNEGNGKMIRFEAPLTLMRYVVPKGYIAIDGMSLTVVEPAAERFAVAFIPHTLANTVAGHYRPGVTVNLEVDVLGKYVEKFIAGQQGAHAGVTRSLLEETGFA